jgi:uncharacterized coiled-coil protein SlyX
MLFLWTVFSKSGWKLIPLNFAYNDAIEGRTWNDLYARSNGKICSKFATYPIRENGQDYIELYCIETVGEWDGITEPNITVPQYNETRIEFLEKENEELKLQNEQLKETVQEMQLQINKLEERFRYLYEKLQNIGTRPYIRSLAKSFVIGTQ